MKPEKIRGLHPPKEKGDKEKPVSAEEEKQSKAVEKAKEFLRNNPFITIIFYFAMMGALADKLPKNEAMEKQQDRMSQVGEDMVDDVIDMWNESMNDFSKKEPAELTPKQKKQVEERAKSLANALEGVANMPGMEEVSERTQTDLAAIGTSAIPHLINILGGAADKEARSLLVWMEEASEPLLIEALNDENANIFRKEAVLRVLGNMSDVSQDTMNTLTKLVGSGEDEDLRFAAAEALVSLGEKSDILPMMQLKIKNAAEDPRGADRALRLLVSMGERQLFAKGIEGINAARRDIDDPYYDPSDRMSLIMDGAEDVEGFVADLFEAKDAGVLLGVSDYLRFVTRKKINNKLVELASSTLRSKDDNLKLTSLMILGHFVNDRSSFNQIVSELSEKEANDLWAFVHSKIVEDEGIEIKVKIILIKVLFKELYSVGRSHGTLEKIYKGVMESKSDNLSELFEVFAKYGVAKIEDVEGVLKREGTSYRQRSNALDALSYFEINSGDEIVGLIRSIYQDSSDILSEDAGNYLIHTGRLEEQELKKIILSKIGKKNPANHQIFALAQMVTRGDEGVRFFQSIKSEMPDGAKKTLEALDGGDMYRKVFGKKG